MVLSIHFILKRGGTTSFLHLPYYSKNNYFPWHFFNPWTQVQPHDFPLWRHFLPQKAPNSVDFCPSILNFPYYRRVFMWPHRSSVHVGTGMGCQHSTCMALTPHYSVMSHPLIAQAWTTLTLSCSELLMMLTAHMAER